MPAPAAEIDIDPPLVRRLLAEQVPQLADHHVTVVDHGWDNTIARAESTDSNSSWMIRLPRRSAAAELIANEIRWLPDLAQRIRSMQMPTPRWTGTPSDAFPWPFYVGRWLPGVTAAEHVPGNLYRAAAALTHFLNELHVPAPPDAPVNEARGVALAERAAAVGNRLAELSDRLPADLAPDRIGDAWERLAAAPAWARPPVWLHGDLHPANMLVDRGTLSAVIDWGDLCSGDPATDLAVVWMLFPADARLSIRAGCGIDPATWARGAGWALNLALAFLTGDESSPMPAIGEHTLRSVLSERF